MKQFKTKNKWVHVLLVVAMSIVAAGPLFPVQAREDAGDLVNYSFAVWLGSGFYKVGSANKRFGVVRFPFTYTLRSPRADEPSFLDRLGFRLLLPALVGFQEETDINYKLVFGRDCLRGEMIENPSSGKGKAWNEYLTENLKSIRNRGVGTWRSLV